MAVIDVVEANKKATRVLMVAFAALGHINPMLSLGKFLLSKGLTVTLATTDPARKYFPVDATVSNGINLEFFSDGCSPDFDAATDMDFFMRTIGEFGPINLSAFIDTQPKNYFSCVIINPFVPWAADVAIKYGIPCAMLWIQPCILYATYYRFFNKLNKFPTSENPVLSVELPGLPVLRVQDLPSFVLPSNTFTCFTDVLADVFHNMDKYKWVFGNSYDELEHDIIRSMDDIRPIIPVGPLIGQDNRSKTYGDSIKWLDEQESSSVIYISFGSIIEFSKSAVESISNGLKKSKRRFLWVVKGEKVLPTEFLEETKEQGKIVNWCPQTEVLSHPSVGCFLTHCGWNSMLESITCGVPIIAYPQWTDQPTNAKLFTDVLKVGVRLEKGVEEEGFTSDDVAKCIEEVMTSDEIKNKATELKKAAEEAMADGGSSDRNIQRFVDEIVGGCNSV
jgi:UDP-glucose:(indol-3-yl)acetate beta-D-glucosyltransferase